MMKGTTKNRNFGLRWADEGRLGNLDFADEIALLEVTQEGCANSPTRRRRAQGDSKSGTAQEPRQM